MNNKTDIEEIMEKCSKLAKEANWTEEDTNRVIAEYREMEAKANKYDSLVEKIKEINKQADKKIKENNKIIKMEWLDSHMAMDDYFARKNKLMRENEILEIERQYTKELLDTEK